MSRRLRPRGRCSCAGPPSMVAGPGTSLRQDGETALEAAVRLGLKLDGDVLAIQGPPGSGKTYTGAQMIVALARAGRKVGVTANCHRVIGNLLDASRQADAKTAIAGAPPVRIGQKPKDGQRPGLAQRGRGRIHARRSTRACAGETSMWSARCRGRG